MHDKIEDARVSGKSVGRSRQGRRAGGARTSPAVDAQGLDPNGAAVDLPDKAALLPAVVRLRHRRRRRTRWTPRTAAISGSTSPRSTPRATARSTRSRTRSRSNGAPRRSSKALSAKAADLVKQLDAGANVASLAKAASVEVKSAKDIRRAAAPRSPPTSSPPCSRCRRTRRDRPRRPTDGWCSRSRPTRRRPMSPPTPA